MLGEGAIGRIGVLLPDGGRPDRLGAVLCEGVVRFEEQGRNDAAGDGAGREPENLPDGGRSGVSWMPAGTGISSISIALDGCGHVHSKCGGIYAGVTGTYVSGIEV